MNTWQAMAFEQEPHNLAAFSHYLRRLGFPHRVSESNGQLVLWVFDESHIEWVKEQYALYEQGVYADVPAKPRQTMAISALIIQSPLSYSLIALSVIGFFLVLANQIQWVSLLSFQGFSVQANTIVMDTHQQWLARMGQGEWWRLFTPMFLHFSWLHLGFNITLLGFFAIQLERHKGAFWLLSHILLFSLVANCAQYLSSTQLFGGMSGVVYGLIAYCAVINWRAGFSVYNCPRGLFYISLLMIVLGFFQVFAFFGVHIANWAHVGGFVTAWLIALFSKLPEKPENDHFSGFTG